MSYFGSLNTPPMLLTSFSLTLLSAMMRYRKISFSVFSKSHVRTLCSISLPYPSPLYGHPLFLQTVRPGGVKPEGHGGDTDGRRFCHCVFLPLVYHLVLRASACRYPPRTPEMNRPFISRYISRLSGYSHSRRCFVYLYFALRLSLSFMISRNSS